MTVSPRLTPPQWLTNSIRPTRSPLPRAGMARAALALSLPVALGMAAGRPDYGALASMGALAGVIGDTTGPYRMRLLTIGVPQLFGAVGVTLGALVHGQGWTAVAVVAAIALVSGMISTIGAVASVSGLMLLLNAVVGAGLPMPDPWWTAPLLLTLGGLFILLLSLLGWPVRRGAPDRAAVAAAYRSTAELYAVVGTSDTAAYDAHRHAVTRDVENAYEVLLARRAHDHGPRGPMVRLLAQLNALIPLLEAAGAAHLHGRISRRPEIAAAVAELADSVTTGRRTAPTLVLPEPQGPADRAVDRTLRHASAVVHSPGSPTDPKVDLLGNPAPLSLRVRRAAQAVLTSSASWRYGLRLALCIGLAQALVSVGPAGRSYWVPLAATFVLKPDFGSVFSRAVQRAVGTAVGLAAAAMVLVFVPSGWAYVPVLMVLGALIPAGNALGFAFMTATVSPVVLLQSDIMSGQHFALVGPQLLDSLLGCAIVLVAGYLLWPESWRTRVADRLAEAIDDTAAYAARAFSGIPHAERVRWQRRLYQNLSSVRSEFQRALTEPAPVGPRAAAWWPLVVAVERVVGAIAATQVRADHGARPPTAEAVTDIERRLRDLARTVRTGTPSPGDVEQDVEQDERDDVLTQVREEVRAAGSIASLHARTRPSGRSTPARL
ncbi:FUSC family protein [Streptomyces sp. NPDC093224]|uniref:FUSC family protein n=1 Tax=Streptomyces sp. NPDC093224 TaxID=3155198 RepID=UPI003430A249